jgi:hypothetical protein
MKFIWILIGLIDLLSYLFISFHAGSIVFILCFLYILWEIGLFTGIKFTKGIFKECEIYYYEYVGEYFLIGKELEKLDLILKKFHSEKLGFIPFAIYYDDPEKVKPKTCRAVIGLMRRNLEIEITKEQEEVITYMKENNLKKCNIPDSLSICSFFHILNTMSKVLGIRKIYTALHANMKNENWKKQFELKEESIPCSVEVYEKNIIEFYVPLKNQERFNLHSIKRQ